MLRERCVVESAGWSYFRGNRDMHDDTEARGGGKAGRFDVFAGGFGVAVARKKARTAVRESSFSVLRRERSEYKDADL